MLEHLFGQVVQDVPVAAGERGDEAVDVAASAQRQAGQLQPGRPAFGPRGQRRGHRVRQRRTGPRSAGRGRDLLQQRRRLPRREPQFRGAQLGQLLLMPVDLRTSMLRENGVVLGAVRAALDGAEHRLSNLL